MYKEMNRSVLIKTEENFGKTGTMPRANKGEVGKRGREFLMRNAPHAWPRACSVRFGKKPHRCVRILLQ